MKYAISIALLFAFGCICEAGDRRQRRSMQVTNQPQQVASQPQIVTANYTPSTTAEQSDTKVEGSTDALDEVNAERAKRGLRPFIHDPLLTQAANACAKVRAERHIHGHLSSDFAYLPSGATATAAGCGALEPSWGWGTCCTYDNYTYAGAAWVMGSDGRRYMHLFVR
jgi:hypothetical protein